MAVDAVVSRVTKVIGLNLVFVVVLSRVCRGESLLMMCLVSRINLDKRMSNYYFLGQNLSRFLVFAMFHVVVGQEQQTLLSAQLSPWF